MIRGVRVIYLQILSKNPHRFAFSPHNILEILVKGRVFSSAGRARAF